MVAVAAVAVLLATFRKEPAAAAPPPVTTQTALVQRTDLTNTETYPGSLGFGDPSQVQGTGTGTVTKLPQVGDVAVRGRSLYRVDDHPVPVFFGDTPLFRTLDHPGITGADVAMVASNLSALGYYHSAVPKNSHDVAFTAAMQDALKRWQADNGLDQTGTIGVGQVLVLPGASRVDSISGKLGDSVAENLFTVTSTTKLVTMPVSAGQVGELHEGAAATIVLPTQAQTTGRITSIATTAQTQSGSGQDSGNGTGQQIQVTVTPDDQNALNGLDAASVQVQITTQVHRGVLAVPISALLALREGGYAIQLPNGQMLPVRTGMFGQQLVEISGPDIREGMRVVVAS